MARNETCQIVGKYNFLDFVNMQFTKKNGCCIDPLRGFQELIDWLFAAGLIDRKQMQRALKLWGSGAAAKRIYQSAITLREALRLMAEKLAAQRLVPRTSIEAINRAIGKRPGCVLLKRGAGRFEELTRLDLNEPEQLMVPIAQSASDLLCHGNFALVKRCANPACEAFFYDTSKNHTRRWCSTTGCGNRMRVAAHYRRRHAAG